MHSLTERDLIEIRKIVSEESKKCKCGHIEDVRALFKHANAIGKGDTSYGVEAIGTTLRIFTSIRRFGGSLGGKLAVTIATLIMLFFCSIFGIGLTVIYSFLKK